MDREVQLTFSWRPNSAGLWLFTWNSFPLFPVNFRSPGDSWLVKIKFCPKPANLPRLIQDGGWNGTKAVQPSDPIQMVTCQGPVNITVIKFCRKDELSKLCGSFANSCDQKLQWIKNIFFFLRKQGKRNEQLTVPLNSSLSVTLDKKEVTNLFTPTVTCSSMWEIRGFGFIICDSHEIITFWGHNNE